MTASPSPEDYLPGEGWVVGPDGMPRRSAARVVLLDEDDRVLLVRGHDAHRPERTWWFTVGGGIDEGEQPSEAAIREVLEETGLLLDPAHVVGPVARRSAIFDFHARSVRQEEVFFAARLPGRGPDRLSTDGWTEIERSFMDEAAWFAPAALREIDVEVFPGALVELVEVVADELARIAPGQPWERAVIDLGHEEAASHLRGSGPGGSESAGPSDGERS